MLGQKYATYPDHIKQAIDRGAIVKGMTMEQVILSVGETNCVDDRSLGGKYMASWSYHTDPYTGKLSSLEASSLRLPRGGRGRCPGDHMVLFEDGYVVEGQTE